MSFCFIIEKDKNNPSKYEVSEKCQKRPYELQRLDYLLIGMKYILEKSFLSGMENNNIGFITR